MLPSYSTHLSSTDGGTILGTIVVFTSVQGTRGAPLYSYIVILCTPSNSLYLACSHRSRHSSSERRAESIAKKSHKFCKQWSVPCNSSAAVGNSLSYFPVCCGTNVLRICSRQYSAQQSSYAPFTSSRGSIRDHERASAGVGGTSDWATTVLLLLDAYCSNDPCRCTSTHRSWTLCT